MHMPYVLELVQLTNMYLCMIMTHSGIIEHEQSYTVLYYEMFVIVVGYICSRIYNFVFSILLMTCTTKQFKSTVVSYIE